MMTLTWVTHCELDHVLFHNVADRFFVKYIFWLRYEDIPSSKGLPSDS